MQPIIAARGVTKTYAEGASAVVALRGIDLEVYPGELVLLMGPSGSGKTTLLSILGCILRASSGSVRIAGREVSGLSEKELPRLRLQHIGFVFQGFNLFPTLTAGENVELMLDLKGVRGAAAKTRVCELLEQVGVGDKCNSFPSDLSGGQKQRVAIARALAGEPDILLADEPTAALDSHIGRSVLEMMRRLAHARNRAVVIVTHDPRLLEFADRIVTMADGLITSGNSGVTEAPAEPERSAPAAAPA